MTVGGEKKKRILPEKIKPTQSCPPKWHDRHKGKGGAVGHAGEVAIEYVDQPAAKSRMAMPEDFVPPRPRSRACDPPGGRRLPSLELLRRDKSRSAWTNYVVEEGPHWKNDLDGMKSFLASVYRQTTPPYTEPEMYNTALLPKQYNPAKDPDPFKLHPPDLVDPQNPHSLVAYGLTLKPVRHVPAWDNSPHVVVAHLLWRRAAPVR